MNLRAALAFVTALAASSDAFAHPGHFPVATIAAGLAHPWLGIDHALTALAVGLWACTQPTGRRWRAPAAFVTAMIVGAFVGRGLGAPIWIDIGIAGALVLLGLLLLAGTRLRPAAALSGIAAFAILHGLAHGAEAPPHGHFVHYVAGLAASTLLLHAVGIAIGTGVRRVALGAWPLVALACSAAGVCLLATA